MGGSAHPSVSATLREVLSLPEDGWLEERLRFRGGLGGESAVISQSMGWTFVGDQGNRVN